MRTLTGLQPSGQPHIGNYFGAMQAAIERQEGGDAFYFIADYHAMTSISNAEDLQNNVRDLAIDFLAAGLDPTKCVFFRQSAVPEVNELAWILSTVCPMGLLERCHSYKDKVSKGLAANHALFAYPVLMAADILLYDSELVPVGKDQKQHLEVTRDLAQKINDRFGENTLVIPKALISDDSTAIVPGLDGAKMSKSYGNVLPLFGAKKAIRKSIMRIPTDSTPVEEPKPVEESIILDLYKLFVTNEQYQKMISEFQAGGQGYGHFKQQLFDAYWNYFADFREKREKLQSDLSYIDSVLKQGAEKARDQATKVLERVRSAVGLA